MKKASPWLLCASCGAAITGSAALRGKLPRLRIQPRSHASKDPVVIREWICAGCVVKQRQSIAHKIVYRGR